jgi:hypothetical protein
MNEDPTIPTEQLLDFLCWDFAMTAERFWPPDETAHGCIDALPDSTYEEDSLEEAEALGWERGQHTRSLNEATEFFYQLEQRGFDPRSRAQREIERSREDGVDLPDIDWTWYEESNRLGYDDD